MTWNFSPPKQCAKTGFFYATFLTYQNSFVYLKSIYLHVISFEGYSVTATMFMQKSHLKIKGKRHGRSLCLLLDPFNFFFLFLEFSSSLFPRPELQSFQEENLVITLAITLVHASPNHLGLNLGLFILRIGVKCKYGTDLSGIEISKTIGIMIISKKF